jgi:uncharacterized caspase-like protein
MLRHPVILIAFALVLLLKAGTAVATEATEQDRGALLQPAAQTDVPTRIALVVGNSNYTLISPLQNPANDARLMAKTLRDVGFDVVVATDASRADMISAMREFGRRLSEAGTEAVGMFYYAGHGVQALNSNFLLPLQATIQTQEDLELEAIDSRWVLRQMERAGNDLNIVVLDACRNNPFRSLFRSSQGGLGRITAPSGSLIAYSAAPGQVALDGTGENSPYTASLARAIKRPGNELVKVFRQARLDVEALTEGRQTPWEEQSLRGDFYFLPPSGAMDEQPIAGLKAGIELAFWNSIKESDDPSQLQTYLTQFPEGTFASLARIKLKQLEESTEPPTQSDDIAALSVPEDETELTRRIQSALSEVGCNPGSIDGKWGRNSKGALERFAKYANVVLPESAISGETLGLFKGRNDRICPLVCGPRQVERNGQCVTKTCPSGQVLLADGSCRTSSAKVNNTPPTRKAKPPTEKDCGKPSPVSRYVDCVDGFKMH